MVYDTVARKALRAHMAKKGIDPLKERSDLEVRICMPGLVPMRGDVLASTGRTMTKQEIRKYLLRVTSVKNRWFSFLFD
jgi:hypothetical protein